MLRFCFIIVIFVTLLQDISAEEDSSSELKILKSSEEVDNDSIQLSGDAFEIADRYMRRGPPVDKSAVKRRNGQFVETNWIQQKLDHFDPNNPRTWYMRYFSNLNNFRPQSPILIFVGGEWEASNYSIINGHIVDMAIEMSAALYYTEHRFYGQSKPTHDVSTANLKYVHTKQALADLAHFIRTIKQNPHMKDSKVVIASGSYGGVMVAWFRKLYPDLVVGAWSSCAPLNAKTDFKEYNEVAGQSIRHVCGEKVYERIRNGFRNLESLYDTNPQNLIQKLKLCPHFNTKNHMDMWDLFAVLSYMFNGIIQNGPVQAITQKICSPIGNFRGTDEDAIAKFFISAMNEKNHPDFCASVSYEGRIYSFRQTDWRRWEGGNSRAWTYQTCTQYGYFQTSSVNQPYGSRIPIEYYLKQCQDIFGITPEQVYRNVNATNADLGGLNIGATNVFYTNGHLDPWSALAIKYNNGKSNVVQWYSHFADFDSINNMIDTREMIALKVEIRSAIRKWLGFN